MKYQEIRTYEFSIFSQDDLFSWNAKKDFLNEYRILTESIEGGVLKVSMIKEES